MNSQLSRSDQAHYEQQQASIALCIDIQPPVVKQVLQYVLIDHPVGDNARQLAAIFVGLALRSPVDLQGLAEFGREEMRLFHELIEEANTSIDHWPVAAGLVKQLYQF
ncbi:hypothetical protein [Endozoicomonas ascidiicola]|uniref:hypothetical protein n=1 Tax=Endozoicomonas ascidiicola TaxID=1698521 RepID=UPI00082C8051|nr:hypothetical protein [Endozoicomonas ascidiicola]